MLNTFINLKARFIKSHFTIGARIRIPCTYTHVPISGVQGSMIFLY